jgi:hypothetical protein
MNRKRELLRVLTRSRRIQMAAAVGVRGVFRKSKEEMLETLGVERRIPLEQLLRYWTRRNFERGALA